MSVEELGKAGFFEFRNHFFPYQQTLLVSIYTGERAL